VLNAVIAQRIVRKICPFCKRSYQAPQEFIDEVRRTLGSTLPKEYQEKSIPLFKGAGCSECNNTGYLGRIGIFEVLKITPKINKLILAQASAKDIQQQALEEGMITMKQDGYWKVLDGITTVEEVLRVAEI
jgi:type II secretory ATPase GspE/PulE/Tfp pilus assembly ATPase PilB-like protein